LPPDSRRVPDGEAAAEPDAKASEPSPRYRRRLAKERSKEPRDDMAPMLLILLAEIQIAATLPASGANPTLDTRSNPLLPAEILTFRGTQTFDFHH
jgi:hypothetical protein